MTRGEGFRFDVATRASPAIRARASLAHAHRFGSSTAGRVASVVGVARPVGRPRIAAEGVPARSSGTADSRVNLLNGGAVAVATMTPPHDRRRWTENGPSPTTGFGNQISPPFPFGAPSR